MKTIKLVVTQEHIDRSEELLGVGDNIRCACCPLALAAQDLWPGYRVTVGGELHVCGGTGQYLYEANLPLSARSAIVRFDQGFGMAPATYYFDVPDVFPPIGMAVIPPTGE